MQEISDQELRALVRSSIARHSAPASTAQPTERTATGDHMHSSHAKFLLPAGGDGDGMCVIEPAVRCTHCGYCQSYGH
jgi:hypothetical protein